MNLALALLRSRVSRLFVIASLVSGCSVMTSPNFRGKDGTTLVFTKMTSSGLPPGVLLERVDNGEKLEIVYSKGSDKILSSATPESESITVGMIRHLQPGEYVLTGTRLGPDSGPFSFAKKFETPLRITLNAREVHYMDSYRVDLKEAPGASATTDKNGITVVTGGLEIMTSVANNMRVDLNALASAEPHVNIASAKNATPDPGD